MADAAHRLCPRGFQDKDGSCSHSQLSCLWAQNKKQWGTNPWKLNCPCPAVLLPRCCTPSHMAASGTTQLPPAQAGLSWTWAHLLAQFPTLLLTPLLLSIALPWRGTSRGWAAIAGDMVCRADPGSIPAGEREAKLHFWGCTHLFFALKPQPRWWCARYGTAAQSCPTLESGVHPELQILFCCMLKHLKLPVRFYSHLLAIWGVSLQIFLRDLTNLI